MIRLAVVVLLFFVQQAIAQFDSTVYRMAQTIQATSLHDHVYQLASPEFEGRETGTPGNRKAAEYLAEQFRVYGIPPIPGDGDYFQEVVFSTIKWGQNELAIAGQPLEHMKDFLINPQEFPLAVNSLSITSLLFLGYGIDDPRYSDYAGVDVKGKNLVIYNREPQTPNGKYKITGTNDPSAWTTDPQKKIKLAMQKGAASVWILDAQFKDHVNQFRRSVFGGDNLMGSPEQILQNRIPSVFLTLMQDQRLFGKKAKRIAKLKSKIDHTGTPYHTSVPVNIKWNGAHELSSLKGVNVLGFIEGSDPQRKDEIVVLSAHYDHLGKRGQDIFFGADDNASGTSAVLEIAQALMEAKLKGQGPKRSVLCMLMTGEEKGLLGSAYYTTYPVFPLKQTVADVNIDMIGRMDAKHTTPDYIYVIGSDRLSTDLHRINEAANATYTHLNLDYTFNADNDPNRFYYRSDHYNFAKNGIPAIFFFSGVHEDYHRATDTPDKILFDKATTIAQLAFYTTWELANRAERIRVDVTGRN